MAFGLALAFFITGLLFHVTIESGTPVAFGATPASTVPQGGTGQNAFSLGAIIFGQGIGLPGSLRLGTSSGLLYATSTNTLSLTNLLISGTCTGCSAGGFAFPFTPGVYGSTAVNATGTALQLKGGLFASSTVRFGNAGVLSQFLWDSTVGKLGIGSTTPFSTLSIGSGNASSSVTVSEYAYGKSGNLPTSTTQTLSPNTSNKILWPLGSSATTLTLCNFIPGQQLTVRVTNPNGTAGALTWNTCSGTQLYWPSKTTPTQTTTANDWDIWSFTASASVGSSTSNVIMISGAQTPGF